MIIVDRIEGEFAVVYINEQRRDIPLSDLPDGVHEGCVLKSENGGFLLDTAAEEQRRKRLSSRTKRLFGQK